MSSIWFCPVCCSLGAPGAACVCGGSHRDLQRVLLGAPGEIPVMLGHLALLDRTPHPVRLLEGICDGPRRYPDQVSSEPRCGGWRHRGRTLWMWQERLEDLPLAGGLPQGGESSSAMALLRALAATSLLLIEAPQQTPLFRAHYARNKRVFAETESFGDQTVAIAPAPPECSEVVDRLQWSFSLSTPRRRFIALLDPERETGEEERLRLKDLSAAFGVFERREEALRWLLEQAPAVSEHPMPSLHRRLVAAEEAAKQAARERAEEKAREKAEKRAQEKKAKKKGATKSRPWSSRLLLTAATGNDEKSGENGDGKKARRPDLVRVADVGGSVGRHLLARLHLQTWLQTQAAAKKKEEEADEEKESFVDQLVNLLPAWAKKQAVELVAAVSSAFPQREEKNNKPVELPGNHWFGAGLWATPTAEGLYYGRIHQLRQGEPPPSSPAPSWSGHTARWWWSKQPFAIELEENAPADDGGPLIIGVGQLRLFGERELAELLERLWRGQRFPATIIRHERADANLLRWVRSEFPQTPEFTDSWEGGMRAVETALRLARQRAEEL